MKCFPLVVRWFVGSTLLFFGGALAESLNLPAGPLVVDGDSGTFPTDMEIVWQADTNALPKMLPIYVVVKQGFSDLVNREALQMGGFPTLHAAEATTQNLVIQDGEDESWTRSIRILPLAGEIEFEDRSPVRPENGVPEVVEVSRQAWKTAARFRLPRADLVEKPEDQKYEPQMGARETFLTRKIHGVEARNFGLALGLGNHGTIRFFSLRWPQLRLAMDGVVAAPPQIMERLRKPVVAALAFGQTNRPAAPAGILAQTRKLTVTRITPFYVEAVSAAVQKPSRRERYLSPFAEVEAKAVVGGTNVELKLYKEILSAPATVEK